MLGFSKSLALLLIAAVFAIAAASAQATERVSITTSSPKAKVFVRDAAGNYAWADKPNGIPGGTFSGSGTGPWVFSDTDFNTSGWTAAVCYPWDDPGTATFNATVTNPLDVPPGYQQSSYSGSVKAYSPYFITSGYSFWADPVCPPPVQGPVNYPPVAKPESFTVNAGDSIEGSLLANDSDPDGGKLTINISRTSKAEGLSSIESDGSFLYTASPGIKHPLQKSITYTAVDPRNGESKSTRALITVVLPKSSSKPRGKRGKNGAIAKAPRWFHSKVSERACFGTGIKTSCFVLEGGASNGGSCKLYRLKRVSLASHPIIGKWSEPLLLPKRTKVGAGKWALWNRGKKGSERLPLFCDTDGSAWVLPNAKIVKVK
jgi:hypothetical protein